MIDMYKYIHVHIYMFAGNDIYETENIWIQVKLEPQTSFDWIIYVYMLISPALDSIFVSKYLILVHKLWNYIYTPRNCR